MLSELKHQRQHQPLQADRRTQINSSDRGVSFCWIVAEIIVTMAIVYVRPSVEAYSLNVANLTTTFSRVMYSIQVYLQVGYPFQAVTKPKQLTTTAPRHPPPCRGSFYSWYLQDKLMRVWIQYRTHAGGVYNRTRFFLKCCRSFKLHGYYPPLP